MVGSELFIGFMKTHILHHAEEEPFYGVWMAEELRRHGYEVSPGSLYPTLHRMERDGLLTQATRVLDGRQRKYYSITPYGRSVLEEARRKIGELVDEVVGRETP